MRKVAWITFDFEGTSASGKTDCWAVRTLDRKHRLGAVKWFGRWRRYAFFPMAATVFEQDCLRRIAEFCEQATASRKADAL